MLHSKNIFQEETIAMYDNVCNVNYLIRNNVYNCEIDRNKIKMNNE